MIYRRNRNSAGNSAGREWPISWAFRRNRRNRRYFPYLERFQKSGGIYSNPASTIDPQGTGFSVVVVGCAGSAGVSPLILTLGSCHLSHHRMMYPRISHRSPPLRTHHAHPARAAHMVVTAVQAADGSCRRRVLLIRRQWLQPAGQC